MLQKTHNIFIIGIKGVAMTNLAIILKKMGKNVTGSDVVETFITDESLRAHHIAYSIGFAPDALPEKTDLLIYAASHGGVENAQVQEAKKRNIPIVAQPEVLDAIFSQFKNKIAVCGTHGKTTTASLAAYLLLSLGLKPSYLIGAPRFNAYWGGEYQREKYFILEADEYAISPPIDLTPKFHHLNPDYIIATNIDFDHPDIYDSVESVKKSFLYFLEKASVKKIIACDDDEHLRSVLTHIPKSKIVTYGFSPLADLVVRDLKEENHSDSSKQYFSASFRGHDLGQFALSLFGKKNIVNAASVILFSLQFGYDIQKVKKALEDFTGAKRRSELITQINNVLLFDDYAHHPAEIEATTEAFHARFPNRRLVLVFQPHTFSRTVVFRKDFARALSSAHLSIVTDIFPSARENKTQFAFNASAIENEARREGKRNVIYQSTAHLFDFLRSQLKKGDVICMMGAGDIYTLKTDIIGILKKIV